MQSDQIKLLFTYGIAAVVVIGGGVMVYSLPPDSQVSLLVAGFIGSALTFVFGAETATRATRAAQSSAASGAETALRDPNAEPTTSTTTGT